MKSVTLLLCSFFVGVLLSYSQDKPVQLKPYGYISHEIMYDTYRSLDTRDGELYLFPKKPVFDVNGKDINKRSKFNMVEVQTRFGVNISGPDALGASLSGKLEADFFGIHQDNVRLFRLRLAYVQMKWEKTELLIGQAFHPTFVLDCFPSTVSFAAAVPFHPLNRSPQLRLTENFTEDFSASVSFLVHGYHISAGPVDAQRNSGLPDTQLQLRYGNKSNVLLGVTAGYKWLSPRDVTTGNVATNKNVGSYNLQAFSKIVTRPLTIKLEGIYGENLSNFVMIGGYGAKGESESIDLTGDYDYANIRTLSLWTDIHSNQKVWQWGFFAGYTENLGSADLYVPLAGLSRYDDLHYLYRLSPRLVYSVNNLSFGLEWSYISAVYAEAYDAKRKPTLSMDPANNNHIIFNTIYRF